MLAPLGLLYGAAMRARSALYRAGALPVYDAGAPVISVGNLTTGGTGKTPLVEWVARRLAEAGRRPCVLTRGYGRANPRSRVLVSDGTRLLADALDGGDEPRLLAESLLGTAAVLSDKDRAAAARWAQAELGSDAFVLDDGFQHLRLRRDLDIVTIDATNPWGGGSLLPRGRLREPLSALRRADVCVITRADLADDVAGLRREVMRLSGGRPVFAARARTTELRPLDDTPPSAASGMSSLSQPIAAFCALGNSQAFFAHLRAGGHSLARTRAFPDHHRYTQKDVTALGREARASGARALLTTPKDAVKLRALRFDLPCFAVEIELEFDDETRLRGLILEALKP